MVQILGNVFMRQAMDNPFEVANRALDELTLGQVTDALVVDMHCEATRTKSPSRNVPTCLSISPAMSVRKTLATVFAVGVTGLITLSSTTLAANFMAGRSG